MRVNIIILLNEGAIKLRAPENKGWRVYVKVGS